MRRISPSMFKKPYFDEDGMDVGDFKKHGKQMIDYICDYMEHISSYRAQTDKKPFYLQYVLPQNPPQKSEDWNLIMDDFEEKIMPGVTHWNHPSSFSYYPVANSYPGILGDMLSSGIACLGFSWFASPASTELEMITLDWYAKALGLPKMFLHSYARGKGGGCIQGSASECIFVSLIAARQQAFKELLPDKRRDNVTEHCKVLSNLVAYTSKESHPSIRKIAKVSYVRLRVLNVDKNNSLRGSTLKQAIEADIREGMVPFYVAVTFGTSTVCSFDNLKEIGQVCREYPHIWLHVDAEYAGNAFICPEFRYLMAGLEQIQSINVCPTKWFLVNSDCSCLWVQNYQHLTEGLVVNKLYLQDDWEDETTEFRQWSISLSRRFRSLKLWLVLRCYGIRGIQHYIRNHCQLAKHFENFIKRDKRLILMNDCSMGVVCFRVNRLDNYETISEDQLTQLLLALINASGRLTVVPVYVQEFFSIRFCVCCENATEEHISHAWTVIQHCLKTMETYITERVQFSTRKVLSPKEQTDYLQFLRINSFTKSVPLSEYRRFISEVKVTDYYSPIFVPENDNDLVEKIDVGRLVKQHGRFPV